MQNYIERLNQTKEVLTVSIVQHADALEVELQAKRDLEWAEALLVSSGVEGKNEAERKANLAIGVKGWVRGLEEAGVALRTRRTGLELARLDWDALGRELRALELGKAGEL